MDVEALFTQLAVDLEEDGVTTGPAHGGSALFVGEHPFACLALDTMAFRLAEDSPAGREALALDGAGGFAPAGDGRVLPGWIAVPVDQVSEWNHLARAALEAACG